MLTDICYALYILHMYMYTVKYIITLNVLFYHKFEFNTISLYNEHMIPLKSSSPDNLWLTKQLIDHNW